MDVKTCYAEEERLHIALVTETYTPEVNGVAMTLERLARGLSSDGHRIDIFRPAQSKNDRSACLDRITHTVMPGMPIPGYREMHFGFPSGRFLLARWQQQLPDAIYVATEGPLGMSAVNAALRLKIPVISGFHTNFHRYCNHYRVGWMAPAIVAYLRRLHNKTDMTLVPTRAMAQDLQLRGFRNVEIMQRGVDTSLFSPLRRSPELRKHWGADEYSIVCIYVGRIAAEKNIQTAVDTVLALSAYYRIRFVLIGDGPLRSKLETKNPDFVFCGTRLGEDLASHYASADVLLFPSRTETFGNVVTEGMASGLAVVAYDEAAAHEHITDFHNGALACDQQNRSFLSVAMRLCQEPKLIRTIGTNAAEYTKQLNWPSIVFRFKSLLQSARNRTRPVNPDRIVKPKVPK